MSSSSSSELKRKRTASSSGEGTTQLSNGNSSSSSKNGTPEKQKKAKKMKKATAGDNGLDTKKKKQQQQQQEEEAGLPWAAASAGGFQLVPLPLKPPHALAAAKEEAAARRYLYIRQHRAGSQVDDDARGHYPTEEAGGATLFVANVGDDTDAGAVEDQLRRLFERCGHPVDSVTLKSMRRVPPADSQRQQQQQRPAHHAGGRGPWLEVAQADDAEARPLVFAHVTFSSPDGLRAALRYNWNSAAAAESDAAGEAAGSGRGVNKWLLEYEEARPDPQRVLAEVDAFMADFDRRQRLAEKEEEAALGKPDADGFVTVRRKGRKKVADGGIPIASAKAAPALAAKAQRQESDKVLLDFYRFQRRENRRKQLADLRLRFEEDKKKIAKLRAQRKFKPF